MNRALRLGQALGLFAAAVFVLGSVGCHVIPKADYPVGIYSVGSETNLAEIAAAGFNIVTGPAKREFLDAAEANGIGVLASRVRMRGSISIWPRCDPPWPGTTGTRHFGRGT